jgi:hypothetical protein
MRPAIAVLCVGLSATVLAQSITPHPYARFIPGTLFQDIVTTPKGGWLYLVGSTTDANYPVTPDAFDRTCGTDGACNPVQGRFGPVPNSDIVLTVVDADGQIRYSTFLGGTGRDDNPPVTLARDGTLWLAGNTTSGAFENAPAGCSGNMLVARFEYTLRRIEHVHCLNIAPVANIELDPDGTLWVLGSSSGQVPTINAMQPINRGGIDMFVAHLSPAQASPLMSTFVGGDRTDLAAALAVTPAGDIAIVGRTNSTNFPLVRAVRSTAPTLVVRGDAAVLVLDRSGQFLEFSTYWGGSVDDSAADVEVDGSGNIFVAGDTASTDFPVTAGAADTDCHVSSIGCHDAFVTRFTPGGEVIASTFFGGSELDIGRDLALRPGGQVALLGSTQSPDFPLIGSQALQRWQPAVNFEHSYLALFDAQLRTALRSQYVGDEQMLPNVPRFIINGAFGYVAGQVTTFTGAPSYGSYVTAIRLP